jgi:hypothetical protein
MVVEQGLAAGHHTVADRHPWEEPFARPGREQNPISFDRLGGWRRLAGHRPQRNCIWSRDYAFGLDVVNLVFAQQKTHAFRELVGGHAAARDHALEVDLDLADFDPVLLASATNRFHGLGRVEQRFRRDAAPVQTHAARQIALDNRHAHFELARANRGDVTARSRSDYDQVIS